jgi:hypothetical protein
VQWRSWKECDETNQVQEFELTLSFWSSVSLKLSLGGITEELHFCTGNSIQGLTC